MSSTIQETQAPTRGPFLLRVLVFEAWFKKLMSKKSSGSGWGFARVKISMSRLEVQRFAETHDFKFPHKLRVLDNPSCDGKWTLSTKYFGHLERVYVCANLILLGWRLEDILIVERD